MRCRIASHVRNIARGAMSTRFQRGMKNSPRPLVDECDVNTVTCMAASKGSASDAPTHAGTDETDSHATSRQTM